MIAVIDYEAGNLTSVETALRYLGAHFSTTSDPETILASDKVIFPGVGEARHSMAVLRSTGIDEAIHSFVQTGKPLLGICLGFQIIQEFSEERDTELLGIIPGKVQLLPKTEEFKVPQIGWNTVSHDESVLFHGIPQSSSFYFVHSYYLSPLLPSGEEAPWICGKSHYGIEFAAAVHKDNVWGTQFHPEKSGPKGLIMLENFLKRIT